MSTKMSDAGRVNKVFRNVQKLSFEELLVYLQSTRLAGTELEIGCFLCNYKDKSICTGRGCCKSYICDMMNEELERLDNLSTATEIEAALKPVYLYRKMQEQKDPVDKMKEEKVDYSTTCNGDDEDLNNRCWQCSRFCFPIGCMVGEE